MEDSSTSIDFNGLSGSRPVIIMVPDSSASSRSIEPLKVTAENSISVDSSLIVPESEITHFAFS